MYEPFASVYSKFLEHPIISTDSRAIPDGCLFFALRGDQFNGNEYARQALDSGASYAIVDDPDLAGHPRVLLVQNTLQTLQQMARHHRDRFRIPVIAITGTNGKTTTKELIHAVLAKKYHTLATQGNLNNHIGVPVTLLNISSVTEIAVIEMGANHPGEIDFLCRIADPGFGIITNTGKAHLEGFGSYEGVVKTKTELYRYIHQLNGLLFVNSADPVLLSHARGIRMETYGPPPATISLIRKSADPMASVEIQFQDGTVINIRSNLYGAFNTANMLAAACIGHHFGVSPDNIQTAIEAYQPVNNRSQLVKTERNTVVMDAYNANPESMRSALNAFAETSSPHKTVILGDMLELGDSSDEEHLNILRMLEQLRFDSVYLVGPVFTRLNDQRPYICFHDSDLAALWFEHHPVSNSMILVKGSRGIRLEKVSGKL